MSSTLLKECRCVCGKLLFKGFLCQCVVEVKCRRCGVTSTWGLTEVRYVVIENDIDACMTDASGDIARLGYERDHLVGKPVARLFPLLREALPEMPEGAYQLKETPLVLRDGSESRAQTCIVPRYAQGAFVGHRIFSVPQ